jgi:hypothetical protein
MNGGSRKYKVVRFSVSDAHSFFPSLSLTNIMFKASSLLAVASVAAFVVASPHTVAKRAPYTDVQVRCSHHVVF